MEVHLLEFRRVPRFLHAAVSAVMNASVVILRRLFESESVSSHRYHFPRSPDVNQ